MRALYPNKFTQLDESRIYVLNTLFNLPGILLLLLFTFIHIYISITIYLYLYFITICLYLYFHNLVFFSPKKLTWWLAWSITSATHLNTPSKMTFYFASIDFNESLQTSKTKHRHPSKASLMQTNAIDVCYFNNSNNDNNNNNCGSNSYLNKL